MTGTGLRAAGSVALCLGVFCILAALLAASVAYLDESDNQDREPRFLWPDHPDPERSERNAGLMTVASASAGTGAVALALGAVFIAAGAAVDRDEAMARRA